MEKCPQVSLIPAFLLVFFFFHYVEYFRAENILEMFSFPPQRLGSVRAEKPALFACGEDPGGD